MQVKGKDKESKTTTKLSKKKEPNDSIQKPGRANQESNKESMKGRLVDDKERQSKQQQQWQHKQTSDRNDKPNVIIAGDSLKGSKGWLMSRRKKVKVHTFSGATTQDMKDYIKALVAKNHAHIYLHIGTNDVANL